MRKNSFAEKFKSLFSSKKIDEEFFEDLTDTLIEGDVGAKTAFEISFLTSLKNAEHLFSSFSIHEQEWRSASIVKQLWNEKKQN